jgi:hypothetical protein
MSGAMFGAMMLAVKKSVSYEYHSVHSEMSHLFNAPFRYRSQGPRVAEQLMNKSGRLGQNIFRTQPRGALSHLSVALG